MAGKQKYESVAAVPDHDEDHSDDDNDRKEAEIAPKHVSEWQIFSMLKKDIKLHSQTSLIHKCSEQEQGEFLEYLDQCCGNHEDFDIYQVLSFEATAYNYDIRQLWDYRSKAFKAVICSFTQLVAITIILYQLIEDALNGEKYFCHNVQDHGEWYMNILAFFISLNFSFTVLGKLNVSKGLYRYTILVDYNVDWIDHWWLYFGLIVNSLVSLGCCWACYFVVFFSTSATGMIFATVSLWYLSRLDDTLVAEHDYEKFKKSAVDGFKGRDKKKARWINKKLSGNPCCIKIQALLYILFGVPFLMLKYITWIASIVIPFYFAVCF